MATPCDWREIENRERITLFAATTCDPRPTTASRLHNLTMTAVIRSGRWSFDGRRARTAVMWLYGDLPRPCTVDSGGISEWGIAYSSDSVSVMKRTMWCDAMYMCVLIKTFNASIYHDDNDTRYSSLNQLQTPYH